MAKPSILIHDGRIWTGSQFTEGNVLVKNGIVEYIGKEILSADFSYNAKDCIVCPGLVDSHIHINPITDKVYAFPAEMSAFPFGVTAAAEASAIYANKEILDSLWLKTVIFVSVNIKDNKPDFRNAENLINIYGSRTIGVKVFFDISGGEVTDISPLRKICDFAAQHNLKVLVHSTGSPVPMSELLECLKPGDICTHIYHGGVNNASDDDFASLKDARERGVILDAGMAGGVHTDFSVLRDAISAGILPDTISSDITSFSAYTRGGRYGLTMCMSMMREAGMSEEDILKAVTSSPAKALGKEKEWGILKPGHTADIAVISYINEKIEITDRWGHSLKTDKGYRCKLTIAGGNVVYRD